MLVRKLEKFSPIGLFGVYAVTLLISAVCTIPLLGFEPLDRLAGTVAYCFAASIVIYLSAMLMFALLGLILFKVKVGIGDIIASLLVGYVSLIFPWYAWEVEFFTTFELTFVLVAVLLITLLSVAMKVARVVKHRRRVWYRSHLAS